MVIDLKAHTLKIKYLEIYSTKQLTKQFTKQLTPESPGESLCKVVLMRSSVCFVRIVESPVANIIIGHTGIYMGSGLDMVGTIHG